MYPGADVTGLFPRIFNIIRGQLFCGIVSLAIVPWKLLSTLEPALRFLTHCAATDNTTASGSGFITFLGSYNIFIAPICGVSCTTCIDRATITNSCRLFRSSSSTTFSSKGAIYIHYHFSTQVRAVFTMARKDGTSRLWLLGCLLQS